MKRLLLGSAALLLACASASAQDVAPYPGPPPAIPAVSEAAYPGTIRIAVDATDLDRRIFRTRQTLPVQGPGPLTLLYPQWLPGNHAPRGPIDKLAGLTVRANGQVLKWRRDPVQVYAFHIDVPAGATALEIELQQLTPTDGDQGRVQVTPEMLNLQWEKALVYPAGFRADRITVEPSVTLPAGWGFGVALDVASTQGGTTVFRPVTLETLVDSPMFAGRYYRQVDLDPGARIPVRLNIVADAPENLVIADQQLQQHRALVVQADRLFGARHFDRYDFLLATSDRLGGIGLEHHRSSENGVGSDYFTDWADSIGDHDLLPHEYVHSWNGKHRRGADLTTPNYNVPMGNTGLWVYEGQTQYWGAVLAARSGLLTKEQALESLAIDAALYDNRPGRRWRNLLDNTYGPIVSARRPQPWASWQRGEDYYVEGQLVWLDADTLIRERSNGRRSLDDFARAFFGPRPDAPGGQATVAAYTFEDVVATLNRIQPYDWNTFLTERLLAQEQGAPLDGLRRGGYRLAYSETPSSVWKTSESSRKVTDLSYSLGLSVGSEGRIGSVMWEGPAFQSGLTVGSVITAVNGETFSGARLRDAVTAAKTTGTVQLLVRTGDRVRPVTVNYRGGLRYPRLERIAGTPARLDAIYAAKR